jgi:ABC-type uncharacterized transport system permease subunit
MSRFMVRSLVVIGALIVLACIGQAVPFQLAFFLILGWIHYLYRVMPQVRVDGSAVLTAYVCLALLTVGLHQFASWLYALMRDLTAAASSNGRRWHWRWTGWMIGGVLLMFVAGLAIVGMTQVLPHFR